MELLPKSEAEARLRRLQVWMESSEVDAVFVQQNADLYYFAGTIQAGLLCLPVSGLPLYLVLKSPTRAWRESPWERIVAMASWKKAPELLEGAGVGMRRIGLELDVLPVGHYQRMQALFPGTEFVDASDAIRRTRMIKSPHEVEQIRRAARMLQDAFERIPQWAVPGVTELEVAAQLEGFLRSRGHQGITRARGFNFELGYGALSAGPSASYPTCFPGPLGFEGLYAAVPSGAGRYELKAGETLMVDVVGGYGGYLADKTRTFALGRVPERLMRAHSFVLELMSGIEAMLAPGTVCSDIYEYAERRVRESPYRETFMGVGDSHVRFVGHGIGLEIDELPVLAPRVEQALEAGMTVAIEPKIFFPEGGVGIEDTYLITPSGFEKLTCFPDEMIEVAIAPEPACGTDGTDGSRQRSCGWQRRRP